MRFSACVLWLPLGNVLKRQLVITCPLFSSPAYILLPGVWREAGGEQTPYTSRGPEDNEREGARVCLQGWPREAAPTTPGLLTQNFMGERNKLLCCLSHRYLASPFLAGELHPNGFRNKPLTKTGYYKGKAIWKTHGPEPRERPD